ncbi:MAG TPA: hypothetical protein VHG51_09880 [Longimicrobiaceae bacterium]|nr:hypothetical protein [Longimicrobiaceae bacterium]
MQLERTSSALRALGERLFALIEDLGGRPPRLLKDGWYSAGSEAGVFLYLYFVETRSVDRPPLVRLSTRWDDSFADDPRVEQKNNSFGEQAADTLAHPDHPGEVAFAEEFVRRALELRRQNARRKPGRRT